jgi:hypothetical protein
MQEAVSQQKDKSYATLDFFSGNQHRSHRVPASRACGYCHRSSAISYINFHPRANSNCNRSPRATPEILIAPSNAEFMNYSISTDVVVNHTDDLDAKARQLDWDPDSTNPNYVDMWWYKSGELIFNPNTSPNYSDASTRFFQRRVIGYNTDSGVTSAIVATRYQLPGLQPNEYPIIIGVIQTGSGQLNVAAKVFLDKMNYTVFQVPPSGVIPGGVLTGDYFKAHPEKIKIVDDAFNQLDAIRDRTAYGKTDFSALTELSGTVLPVYIEGEFDTAVGPRDIYK